MNDLIDEWVEKAARAMCTDAAHVHHGRAATVRCGWHAEQARAALEAIGLPALLERVEAAERNLVIEREIMDSALAESQRALKSAEASALTLRDMYETEHRELLAAIVDRHTLAAKVADAEARIEQSRQWSMDGRIETVSGLGLDLLEILRAALTGEPTHEQQMEAFGEMG